jgi:TetR/AcrR family transcriptional regulator
MKPGKTFHNLPQAKQNRIITAAVGEFSRQGYAGARVSAIADKVGIAKGSLFQYFGDKKRLFLFLFERTVERVKDHLRAVRDQTQDQNVFDRIERILASGVEFAGRHPHLYTLYLKLTFESGTPLKQEMIRQVRADSIEFLREILLTGQERGDLRADVDLDQAAFILDALFERFLQALSQAHLDAGAGLYRADEAVVSRKIRGLIDVLRFGLGVPS